MSSGIIAITAVWVCSVAIALDLAGAGADEAGWACVELQPR